MTLVAAEQPAAAERRTAWFSRSSSRRRLDADRTALAEQVRWAAFVMSDVAEIQSMWDAWKRQRFPAEYSGKDVAGICVTSLDSFAAGCIDTFVFRKGHLDGRRISILEKCKDDLEVVANALDVR